MSTTKAKSGPRIFCFFIIFVNLAALATFRFFLPPPPPSFHDEFWKILFLVAFGLQSIWVASIIRMLFFSKGKRLNEPTPFLARLKEAGIGLLFPAYILSALVLLGFAGYKNGANLFVLSALSVAVLLLNVCFFYWVNKSLSEKVSAEIMSVNSLIFFSSTSTIGVFSFSKLILFYHPLWGLLFSFVLK